MVLCIIVVEASKLEHHCKVKYKGPEPCSNFLASTIVLDSYGFMGLLPAEPARLQNSGFLFGTVLLQWITESWNMDGGW